ncbi:hypothetical protein K5549_010176, partial [Capra hircus]
MGTPGQCMRKMKEASRLTRVQSRQNLMIPEPRSLNLFTKNPPRNVPPPPAGTTRYPEEREGLRAILGALGAGASWVSSPLCRWGDGGAQSWGPILVAVLGSAPHVGTL